MPNLGADPQRQMRNRSVRRRNCRRVRGRRPRDAPLLRFGRPHPAIAPAIGEVHAVGEKRRQPPKRFLHFGRTRHHPSAMPHTRGNVEREPSESVVVKSGGHEDLFVIAAARVSGRVAGKTQTVPRRVTLDVQVRRFASRRTLGDAQPPGERRRRFAARRQTPHRRRLAPASSHGQSSLARRPFPGTACRTGPRLFAPRRGTPLVNGGARLPRTLSGSCRKEPTRFGEAAAGVAAGSLVGHPRASKNRVQPPRRTTPPAWRPHQSLASHGQNQCEPASRTGGSSGSSESRGGCSPALPAAFRDVPRSAADGEHDQVDVRTLAANAARRATHGEGSRQALGLLVRRRGLAVDSEASQGSGDRSAVRTGLRDPYRRHLACEHPPCGQRPPRRAERRPPPSLSFPRRRPGSRQAGSLPYGTTTRQPRRARRQTVNPPPRRTRHHVARSATQRDPSRCVLHRVACSTTLRDPYRRHLACEHPPCGQRPPRRAKRRPPPAPSFPRRRPGSRQAGSLPYGTTTLSHAGHAIKLRLRRSAAGARRPGRVDAGRRLAGPSRPFHSSPPRSCRELHAFFTLACLPAGRISGEDRTSARRTSRRAFGEPGASSLRATVLATRDGTTVAPAA